MVVGFNISLYPPSAVTFLAALKNMVKSFGVPSSIIPDNGPEIKNTTFSAVFEKLCITILRAQVGDPNGNAGKI
jgi:putative transposase